MILVATGGNSQLHSMCSDHADFWKKWFGLFWKNQILGGFAIISEKCDEWKTCHPWDTRAPDHNLVFVMDTSNIKTESLGSIGPTGFKRNFSPKSLAKKSGKTCFPKKRRNNRQGTCSPKIPIPCRIMQFQNYVQQKTSPKNDWSIFKSNTAPDWTTVETHNNGARWFLVNRVKKLQARREMQVRLREQEAGVSVLISDVLEDLVGWCVTMVLKGPRILKKTYVDVSPSSNGLPLQ